MSTLCGFLGVSNGFYHHAHKDKNKRVGGKNAFNVPLLGDTISMEECEIQWSKKEAKSFLSVDPILLSFDNKMSKELKYRLFFFFFWHFGHILANAAVTESRIKNQVVNSLI